MNIVIERFHKSSYSYDGILKIAGQKICDTVENIISALPPDTYNVIIHTCKQYRRKMPCIILPTIDSPSGRGAFLMPPHCSSCPKMSCVTNNSALPRYCPQIKIGNGVHNRTDGSIIIGEYICPGCLKHPIVHFNRLIDRLDKAQNRGELISLTIKDISL